MFADGSHAHGSSDREQLLARKGMRAARVHVQRQREQYMPCARAARPGRAGQRVAPLPEIGLATFGHVKRSRCLWRCCQLPPMAHYASPLESRRADSCPMAFRLLLINPPIGNEREAQRQVMSRSVPARRHGVSGRSPDQVRVVTIPGPVRNRLTTPYLVLFVHSVWCRCSSLKGSSHVSVEAKQGSLAQGLDLLCTRN